MNKLKYRVINYIGRLWNSFDCPMLGELKFDILTKVYRIFPLIGGIDFPRLEEWQFVIKNLPASPAKILDVGATTSLFPFKLKALKYETYCLDQRLPSFSLPKSIVFCQDNLMDVSIDSDTFDAISCISVIEHVGMGRYNDPKCSENGDEKAIKEMLRILKPTGYLIITTNICRKTYVYKDEIRYGKDRLDKLISLGKIIKAEYRYFDGRRWVGCSEQKAFNQKGDDFGLAMYVLTKKQ
ncbi:MAG: class I SAM-dependent methyltransferase [Candidatus Omnitrophica bacterium]|nr:class I SAM-dependent methyltransferase [Candidatus Omnitrophota bacterium]